MNQKRNKLNYYTSAKIDGGKKFRDKVCNFSVANQKICFINPVRHGLKSLDVVTGCRVKSPSNYFINN